MLRVTSQLFYEWEGITKMYWEICNNDLWPRIY